MIQEHLRVTEEENKELVELQESYYKLIYELGELSMEETTITNRMNVIQERKRQITDLEFTKLQSQQDELAKSLSDKYGKGTVNTETGVFTPEP